MNKRYILEIIWNTGDYTQIELCEEEYDLLKKHGTLYILAKYELEGAPDARPVSFSVWDKAERIDVTPSPAGVAHA